MLHSANAGVATKSRPRVKSDVFFMPGVYGGIGTVSPGLRSKVLVVVAGRSGPGPGPGRWSWSWLARLDLLGRLAAHALECAQELGIGWLRWEERVVLA